jgi:hypothetical protein
MIGGEANMSFTEHEVIDETSDHGKLMAAAKKRKFIAMLNHTMAFDSEGWTLKL